jgi:hypothetical protein
VDEAEPPDAATASKAVASEKETASISQGYCFSRWPWAASRLQQRATKPTRRSVVRPVLLKVRPTPRISCERPVPAEGRARGVPLLRVPWGRSEGDRQLHLMRWTPPAT